MSSKDYI